MKQKTNDKKLPPTRRQAIAMTGSCGLLPMMFRPMDVLINGLVDGIIRKAQAESTPAALPPRNFVYVHLQGGSPRWYFDLPLLPFSTSAPITPQPMMVTRFQLNGGPNAGVPEYGTTPITVNGTTFNMPWLWSSLIPTASGGTVPMSSLLNNMLMIRGLNMLVDGHGNNYPRHIRPTTSSPSIPGAVTDISKKPAPAVQLPGGPGNFYSRTGIGQTIVSSLNTSANPIGQVLSPFDRTQDGLTASYLSRRDAFQNAVNQALTSLGNYANSGAPGASNLFSMRNQAESLITTGIGNVGSSYTTLYNKYQNLITTCANYNALPVIGLTDKPIPNNLHSGNGLTGLTSVNSDSQANPILATNTDMRTLLSSATNVGFAGGFAMAEYLITNGYSSSVVFGSSGVGGLTFSDSGPNTGGMIFDEHFVGMISSMVINSFMYRALAACLYELSNVLKSNNLWEETVVQLAGDFNRLPRDNGSGSDHGYMASSVSVLSGAIQAPMIVGNTFVNSAANTQYQTIPSSWGVAAPANIGGVVQPLTYGHSSSTVAQLLRVQHPLPNNATLVVENTNGGITPNVETATNKPGGS